MARHFIGHTLEIPFCYETLSDHQFAMHCLCLKVSNKWPAALVTVNIGDCCIRVETSERHTPNPLKVAEYVVDALLDALKDKPWWKETM